MRPGLIHPGKHHSPRQRDRGDLHGCGHCLLSAALAAARLKAWCPSALPSPGASHDNLQEVAVRQ